MLKVKTVHTLSSLIKTNIVVIILNKFIFNTTIQSLLGVLEDFSR